MWVGHVSDGHGLHTRTNTPTPRGVSVHVAHELGRKFISLHLDDEAALKRDVILNQFRLIQRLS